MTISCFCDGVSGSLIHESFSGPFDNKGLDDSQDEVGFFMCSYEVVIGSLGEMVKRLYRTPQLCSYSTHNKPNDS